MGCLGVQRVGDKNPLVGLSQAVQLRMCSTHWGTLLGGFGKKITDFTGRLVDMRNTKPSKMNGRNMSSLMEACFQIMIMFLSKCDGCRFQPLIFQGVDDMLNMSETDTSMGFQWLPKSSTNIHRSWSWRGAQLAYLVLPALHSAAKKNIKKGCCIKHGDLP